MKNYICDVIDRYIKHDYPEEVNQDFRGDSIPCQYMFCLPW